MVQYMFESLITKSYLIHISSQKSGQYLLLLSSVKECLANCMASCKQVNWIFCCCSRMLMNSIDTLVVYILFSIVPMLTVLEVFFRNFLPIFRFIHKFRQLHEICLPLFRYGVMLSFDWNCSKKIQTLQNIPIKNEWIKC